MKANSTLFVSSSSCGSPDLIWPTNCIESTICREFGKFSYRIGLYLAPLSLITRSPHKLTNGSPSFRAMWDFPSCANYTHEKQAVLFSVRVSCPTGYVKHKRNRPVFSPRSNSSFLNSFANILLLRYAFGNSESKYNDRSELLKINPFPLFCLLMVIKLVNFPSLY